MSAPRSCDVIVIGGGTSGLIASAYLAKAGKKVLLLEAEDRLGGLCAAGNHGGFSYARGAHTLYALDPFVVRDLKLARKGLRFAGQELALTGLRADGKHIVISRNVHDTAASLAVHSRRDAEAWPLFRKELFGLARAMRPLWWEARGTLPTGAAGRSIARIARMGAAAWLDSWFESEALKATLCFDSTAGGFSSLEPGSALSLVWRAAQEISGLQGAVAIPLGGVTALADALATAARDEGCELRTGARVDRLILDGNRVAGVQTQSGEACFAPLVFLAANSAHKISPLLPPGALGFAQALSRAASRTAEAMVVLTLRNAPQIAPSRFVVAEKLETYASAEISAGQIADELPLEFVIPTLGDASLAPPGQHILSALVRPVPCCPEGDWPVLRSKLAAQVVTCLERLTPNLSRDITHVDVFAPELVESHSTPSVSHMLTPTVRRVETAIGGLFVCGADAEPVSCISGRAARIAVTLAVGS